MAPAVRPPAIWQETGGKTAGAASLSTFSPLLPYILVTEVADTVATMDDQRIPESRLLSLAKTGDLDAFEQIVMMHERKILALTYRLTGNLADAQDAAQDTFIRLHQRLSQIDSDRSVGPWLYTVAVNACRDMARRQQRARTVPMEELAAADPAAGPEALFTSRERERHLRAGLRRLPEKERAALLLREMEGLSTEEVAHILGSSETTVRSQISTARLKLRKFFAAWEGRR